MATNRAKTLNRIEKLEADIERNKAQLVALKHQRQMTIGQLAEKYGLHLWSDEELILLFKQAADERLAT